MTGDRRSENVVFTVLQVKNTGNAEIAVLTPVRASQYPTTVPLNVLRDVTVLREKLWTSMVIVFQ